MHFFKKILNAWTQFFCSDAHSKTNIQKKSANKHNTKIWKRNKLKGWIKQKFDRHPLIGVHGYFLQDWGEKELVCSNQCRRNKEDKQGCWQSKLVKENIKTIVLGHHFKIGNCMILGVVQKHKDGFTPDFSFILSFNLDVCKSLMITLIFEAADL